MISLAVDSLYYNIAQRDRQSKLILSNIHMLCKPGTLTGIMGPSGSGKTTLLNALAGRVRTVLEPTDTPLVPSRTQLTGSILLNGHRATQEALRKYSKYVMQRDELLGYLTVEESIRYSAYLKMKGKTRKEQDAKVESTISELGLQSCRHVLVGDEELKGISGGQKKRVSVALELLTDPPLLFLDEPTSGLDSSLAFDVMKVLSRLAKRGKTMIATIHQPRPQIFQMLDNLVILAEGQVIYHGAAAQVTDYLNSIGYPVPTGYATSDFLLDLLTPDDRKSELPLYELERPPSRIHSKLFDEKMINYAATAAVQPQRAPSIATLEVSDDVRESIVGRPGLSQEALSQLPRLFAHSQWHADLMESLSEVEKNPSPLPITDKAQLKQAARIWVASVMVLWRRLTKRRLRQPSTFVVQFIVSAWMGLFCGLIWYQTPLASSDNVDCDTFNRLMGGLGWTVLEVSWGVFSMVVEFPDSRPLFNREVANKMYSPSAYYLARNLSDLPFICCTALVHVLLAFWLVGYGTNSVLTIYFILAAVVNAIASSGFMLMIATFSPSCTTSSVGASVGMVAVSLNFGYFISVDAMPAFWRGTKWISWMFYSYTGIQLEIFKNDLEVVASCTDYDDVSISPWKLLGFSIALALAFRFIGYFGLKYTNRRVGLES